MQGSGWEFRVSGLGFNVNPVYLLQGIGCRGYIVWGGRAWRGIRVSNFVFRVSCFMFRVWTFVFRGLGFGFGVDPELPILG